MPARMIRPASTLVKECHALKFDLEVIARLAERASNTEGKHKSAAGSFLVWTRTWSARSSALNSEVGMRHGYATLGCVRFLRRDRRPRLQADFSCAPGDGSSWPPGCPRDRGRAF